MSKTLPKEFWEWARSEGFPDRGPAASVENYKRMAMMPELRKRWYIMQKQQAATKQVK